jgi:hypothetical protein
MISVRRPAPSLALIALLGAIALLAAPSALAGGKQFPTIFTKFKYEVKNGEAEFKGAVDSSKGGCVGDRKVVLYRKHNGEKKKLGGDHTNNKGKFSIDLGKGAPKDGTYYAVVNKSKIGEDGKKNTCLDRTSPKVKLS